MALLPGLADSPALWRGGALAVPAAPGIPTGFPALDAVLPGGGWPVGVLTELIAEREGIGELTLLLPALAKLSGEGRWIAFVAPPRLPYAPALAAAGVELSHLVVVQPEGAEARLWAIRQVLASHAFGMVLAWLDEAGGAPLRRLQLAAEGGSGAAALFRPPAAARQSSPAALRLRLGLTCGRLAIEVLKRRGPRVCEPVILDLPRAVRSHAVVRDLPPQPAAAGLPARHA